MVDDIVHELETGGREVPSSLIGARVLEKLRAIDEVAYLRYAVGLPALSGRRSIRGCHPHIGPPNKTQCASTGIVSS
jgi:hypothetical protein